MLELNFIEYVAERDIDLLILEELYVNEKFREMFSTLVFGESVYQSFLGVWHSVYSEQLGESDLLFLFEAMDGVRTAILIENKIDAAPMLEQGARYRLRGEAGIKSQEWGRFKTCMIAPQQYLKSVGDSNVYDANISYETIHSFFVTAEQNEHRSAYKAKLLQEGIEKNRRGYQPIENGNVTDFVKQYFDYANARYPALNMQHAKSRQAGSSWVQFYPDVLPPEEVTLAHQLTNGEVKLLFKGQADNIEAIQAKYKDCLSGRMVVKKASQSTAILMKVPPVFPLAKSFEEEKEVIELALDCLSQLTRVYAEKIDD